jgi:hypothetical protein
MQTIRHTLLGGRLAARLMVYPGELVRVPVSGQTVQVATGKAWVSVSGHDYVLCAMEHLTLPVGGEDALISGHGPSTVVEVTGP